jgi:hypothetical protein
MENEEHKEEFGVSTYAYEGQEHLSQSLMLNSTNVELEAPSAELQSSPLVGIFIHSLKPKFSNQ